MKVLFAGDGKGPAQEALKLLIKLGDPERIEVTAASVASFDMALEEGAATEGHYSPEAGGRRADEIIDAALHDLRDAGFKAAGRLLEGHPPLEILHAVERDWYELTVIGSGTASWLGQALLGGVSTQVLHSSPTSVLVTHQSRPGDAGKVLLGTDGSRGSEFGLRSIAQFADPKRCSVQVTSVSGTDRAADAGAGRAARDRERPNLDQFTRAERHMSHAAAQLEEAGFDVTQKVAVGHPVEQLLQEVREGDFDLVVVGARGLGPLQRVVLGSVSDRVVRLAPATLVGRHLA